MGLSICFSAYEHWLDCHLSGTFDWSVLRCASSCSASVSTCSSRSLFHTLDRWRWLTHGVLVSVDRDWELMKCLNIEFAIITLSIPVTPAELKPVDECDVNVFLEPDIDWTLPLWRGGLRTSVVGVFGVCSKCIVPVETRLVNSELTNASCTHRYWTILPSALSCSIFSLILLTFTRLMRFDSESPRSVTLYSSGEKYLVKVWNGNPQDRCQLMS